MLLELTSDQAFFRDTTARFLDEHVPPGALRGLRHHPVGYDADWWVRGADLGWTSLLVAEEHGGGTVSGDGLIDLTLVAHEFGLRAAPGPLTPTNVVAATLSETGAPHTGALAGLLDGTATAAWCWAEPRPRNRLGAVSLDIRPDGDEVVVHGVKRPVEAALAADHLLVTGRSDDGLTQVLVPRGTPGVTVTPLRTVDVTRRFATVAFDGVRLPATAVVGERGGAAAQVERQLQRALVLVDAEAVGAMQRAFDLTVEWAFDRYSFGRPLSSYQALKHRFADMKSWLEASHAVSDEAAAAVASGAPDAPELVSAAKAFIGQHGAELVQDCVQIHGGIGVTYDHDLHLFLRRQTVNRALFGTPGEHRRRITDLIEQRERAA